MKHKPTHSLRFCAWIIATLVLTSLGSLTGAGCSKVQPPPEPLIRIGGSVYDRNSLTTLDSAWIAVAEGPDTVVVDRTDATGRFGFVVYEFDSLRLVYGREGCVSSDTLVTATPGDMLGISLYLDCSPELSEVFR